MNNPTLKIMTPAGIIRPDGEITRAAEAIIGEGEAIVCLFGAHNDCPADEYVLLRAVQNAAEFFSLCPGITLSVNAPTAGGWRSPPQLGQDRLPALVRAASELAPNLRAGAFTPMRKANPTLISHSGVVLIDCCGAVSSRQIAEAVLLIKSQPEYFYDPKPVYAAVDISDPGIIEESREFCAQNGAILIQQP